MQPPLGWNPMVAPPVVYNGVNKFNYQHNPNIAVINRPLWNCLVATIKISVACTDFILFFGAQTPYICLREFGLLEWNETI